MIDDTKRRVILFRVQLAVTALALLAAVANVFLLQKLRHIEHVCSIHVSPNSEQVRVSYP